MKKNERRENLVLAKEEAREYRCKRVLTNNGNYILKVVYDVNLQQKVADHINLLNCNCKTIKKELKKMAKEKAELKFRAKAYEYIRKNGTHAYGLEQIEIEN